MLYQPRELNNSDMGELRYAEFYTPQEQKPPLDPLQGSPDFVRVHWEDELMQFALRPYLRKMVRQKLQKEQQIRILDFGAGFGHNFPLLSKIKNKSSISEQYPSYILPEEFIELYLGLDMDYQIVEEANDAYRTKKKVRFIRYDYGRGLGPFKDDAPFDLYYSSYGALSQLSPNALRLLIQDIAEQAQDGSLLVLDFKGKNSIFNCLMMQPNDDYPYPWVGEDIEYFIKDIQSRLGIGLDILKKIDRSIFMASSVEQQHAAHLIKPIREAINSLLTPFQRTDLQKLLIKPETFEECQDSRADAFFCKLSQSWNLLIKYAQKRFERELKPQELRNWDEFPPSLQFGLLTLDRILKDTEWIAYGDPRANIIEPHIAYVLRSFEHEMQSGLGCGHYLSLILRIRK